MTGDWQEDLISIESAGTLDGLFYERVRRSPGRVAYRAFDHGQKRWIDYKWEDAGRAVALWRAALRAEGLSEGDRVAIRLRNGVEWVWFDQAAHAEGLVTVPVYTDDRPDSVAYVLEDSGARVLLVLNLAQWEKLASSLEAVTCLDRVLILESCDERRKSDALSADGRVRFVDDWLTRDPLPPNKRQGDPNSLASIVYTSGTTGRPKGVMLSHANVLFVAHAAAVAVDCFEQDLFLSFLPLSHTLESTGGYCLPMMVGATVAYSRSANHLAEDLLTVRPTVLIAVPRIFERVHDRMMAQLDKASTLARALFFLTVRVGWRRFLRGQGRAGWQPSQLLHPLLQALVAKKISARLGGRLRYAVSGGAALPAALSRTFVGLGVNILQGYGLTETSPVISVNRPAHNDPASVGEALPGIEVRIGAADELQVRSPGVMLGYWNNHTATRAVIDPDGWLHTGDQARLADRRIYITGRIKDILVLSNGEKVPPGDMESAMLLHPLIDQVLVVGEGRPCLAALIVINPDAWFGVARELGLDPYGDTSLEDDRLSKKMLTDIRALLHGFPGYAKIRRVRLLRDGWTVENGLMTPTLKLKRASILEALSDEVQAMYGGD
jgi:long-chain acyl-CoA synthetase